MCKKVKFIKTTFSHKLRIFQNSVSRLLNPIWSLEGGGGGGMAEYHKNQSCRASFEAKNLGIGHSLLPW